MFCLEGVACPPNIPQDDPKSSDDPKAPDDPRASDERRTPDDPKED